MAPYVAAGRSARTVTKSLRQQLGHIATVRYVHVTWHITMMCFASRACTNIFLILMGYHWSNTYSKTRDAGRALETAFGEAHENIIKVTTPSHQP
jgi:hypothetical protein